MSNLPTAPRNNRLWPLALLALFLAAALLVDGISRTYMHHDEHLVYHYTRRDAAYTVSYLSGSDTHPPLWFSFFWLWRQFTGTTELAGRMQAVLFSLLALALVYQIGRTWFGAARYGVFAVVALSVMALFFQYALEIRPYGLVMLLASLSMWSFQRWLARGARRWGVVYGVTAAAMLYVHYFLVMLLIVQALYFIARRPPLRLWRQAVGVAALAFLLWSPWLPSFLNQIRNLRNAELVGGNARGAIGAGTTTEPTSLDAVLRLVERATNGQPALVALVIVAGGALLWRRGAYRLALVWAFGVPAVSLAINTVAAVYAPRYILAFIIGLALVTGAGLAALPVPARARWAALAVFAAISLYGLPSQLPKDRLPMRDIVAGLAGRAREGDVLYYDRANESDDIWRWEIARQLPAALRESAVTTLEAAQPARRVWYITANWFYDDVQANFKALEATHPLQDVLGDCNRWWCFLIQLMEAPPWSAPQTFGQHMAFWGADVDAVSRGQISVRLWWRVQQPPPVNYSIGLHVLDANGALVAQADGPIRHYRDTVVDTSQLEPGRIYVDFRDVLLPPNTAPGDYQLALIVYDWTTGDRLRLANGDDALPLQSVTMP